MTIVVVQPDLDLVPVTTVEISSGYVPSVLVSVSNLAGTVESITDHGELGGLADDDHSQYMLANGTRNFSAAVAYTSHPTFSADTSLVDKKYVDDSIVLGGGYTDEQAQDAVGGILTDTASVDFSYNDAGGTISAAVLPAGVNHDALSGFVANEHIDWTQDQGIVNVHSGNIPDLSSVYETAGAVTTHESTYDHTLITTAIQADDLGSAAYVDTTAFDAAGAASGAVSAHELTYDHTLIGTAVQSGDLGTAAALNYGTAVGDVVILSDVGGGTAGLPAVDGSQLTGLPSGGVTDHGALSGLTDDDHSQYILANGTRAFSAKVSYSSHPTFSADAELVDKKYVDDAVTLGGGYTDEQAQDAVGDSLVDSASVDLTYDDGAGSITAVVLPAGVNHNALSGYVTNQHIDWTQDQGATNIHAGNIPDLSGSYEVVGAVGTHESSYDHTLIATAVQPDENAIVLGSGAAASGTVFTADGASGTTWAAIPAQPIDWLTDVTIATPAIDQILKYDGAAWINAAPSSISASAGVDFFPDDTAIIAAGAENTYPIKTLTKYPVGGAEDVDSIVLASNTVPYGTYLYDAALGSTSIDAGVWTFSFYVGVSSAVNVTSLSTNVMRVRPGTGTVTVTGTGTSRTATASSGTPFSSAAIDASATNIDASWLRTPKGLYQITARASDTEVTITTPTGYGNESTVAYSVHKKLFNVSTGEINNVASTYASMALIEVSSAQPVHTIEATDKLAGMFFGTSDGSRTVYFSHNGTSKYTHFHTPLATRHNDLAGLQGGAATEQYHLTAAQATNATTAQAASTASIRAIGTTSTTACAGDDTRLSDARAPTAHAHEGTAVLSTGETGGSKYLREDGDGTCSWQTPTGGTSESLSPLLLMGA